VVATVARVMDDGLQRNGSRWPCAHPVQGSRSTSELGVCTSDGKVTPLTTLPGSQRKVRLVPLLQTMIVVEDEMIFVAPRFAGSIQIARLFLPDAIEPPSAPPGEWARLTGQTQSVPHIFHRRVMHGPRKVGGFRRLKPRTP
jgi:hypothetical protein